MLIDEGVRVTRLYRVPQVGIMLRFHRPGIGKSIGPVAERRQHGVILVILFVQLAALVFAGIPALFPISRINRISIILRPRLALAVRIVTFAQLAPSLLKALRLLVSHGHEPVVVILVGGGRISRRNPLDGLLGVLQ